MIRADTDRIRRTAFSLFFILLLAADSGMAGQDAASGEDTATGQYVPETVHYIKHGVPRIRTGAASDEKTQVLAGPVHPPGSDLLVYKPADGYVFGPYDIIFKPSYTLILQGTPNPNLPPGSGKFGVSWNLYLDFEKKLGDWGLIFCQLMSGWGQTVAPDLDLFSNVNYSYYDIGGRVKLRRYYYEQYLCEKRVTLRVGMMKAPDWFDQNNCEDDSDVEFLADIFNTSPAVEWPSNWATTFAEEIEAFVPGADYLELRAAHFEGDGSYQQFFRHGLYIAQATIRTDKLLKLDSDKYEGHYRAYGWLNNRDHAKYAAAGQTAILEDYLNYGFGASIDQKINRYTYIFGRCGWQRPDVVRANGGALVEWSWSAGMQINGCVWKRPDDRFAFAVGQDFVSKPFIDAGNPGANEGHIEVYYAWKLNPCLTVSPDIQLIWNPNGVGAFSKGDAECIFVYGARLHYVL